MLPWIQTTLKILHSSLMRHLLAGMEARAGKELVFVSLDDGKNWTKTSFLPETEWSVKPIWASITDESKNFIKVIEPHPANENILFVGTNSALFKSDDKGLNWERVDADFHRTDILGIKINPQNPDEVS